MLRRMLLASLTIVLVVGLSSCRQQPGDESETEGKQRAKMVFTGAKGEVKLMTLDPGHFHAALIQKVMYDQVSPTVYVFAPAGSDVQDHLNRIEGFNTRADNPTSWEEIVYTGDDYLEKMLEERPGNVVVLSGSNKKKAQYIKACADAGLHVLADKPMCIDAEGFKLIEAAFDSAKKNNVLIYDIMTERSEITTILQKALAADAGVFGQLQTGTVDEPAVVKESVHHFFKYVSGNPIKRPGWYVDTTQQGEGIVDVTTHLVDLVMWETFPDQVINYDDIEVKRARRWPTMLSQAQYTKITRLEDFPDFLQDKLDADGQLPCYANGEIIFTIKGIYARAAVTWNFQAPEGAKDTHYSIMRGTNADVIIRQGKEEDYKPELYITPAAGTKEGELLLGLVPAIAELGKKWPGVVMDQKNDMWHVVIPDKYRIGHEAHFGEVAERFLKYLVDGKLPAWEEPDMKTKYHTTTTALKKAMQ